MKSWQIAFVRFWCEQRFLSLTNVAHEPHFQNELKIDLGPGYRVYYLERAERLILLLADGDKSTQKKDIETALELARDFEE